MSPVNISVHTTNPELRGGDAQQRFAACLGDKIKRIRLRGDHDQLQIVVCQDE
jgi:NifB/MoaA-like Fe-S oxidoreductase